MLHTPTGLRAFLDDLPQFRPLRRPAYRLHPRAGAPRVDQSSIGGPLLWPVDDPWPQCRQTDRHVIYSHGVQRSVDDPSVPAVGVIQVLRADVPILRCPPERDLLQVLWCPVLHLPDYTPRLFHRWRRLADVDLDRVLSSPPIGPRDEDFVASPCTVAPEAIVDYPNGKELPPPLQDEITSWYHSDTELQYPDAAPGSKVGGWANWVNQPEPLVCPNGHLASLLLTIASWEYDANSKAIWQPVEDVGRHVARADAGLQFEDAGDVYLSMCEAFEIGLILQG